MSEKSASSTVKKQEKKIVESLTKRTHFSSQEIERLLNLYRSIVDSSPSTKIDRMDRKLFRQFLHSSFNMTDDILMDRIFKYFNSNNDGDITRDEWVIGFNVFLKGTADEQMNFCFTIYDLNDDGYISKEEMITMMKTCLVKQGTNEEDGDEGVKDLIEMTLKKMDHDKDGRVSFPDFEATVRNEPLMMEAFGPCLPNSSMGCQFLKKFLDHRPNNSIFYSY